MCNYKYISDSIFIATAIALYSTGHYIGGSIAIALVIIME